jgi:hypothetical protein
MSDECLHESWECSGRVGIKGVTVVHDCTDCDISWTNAWEKFEPCDVCSEPEEDPTQLSGFITKDSGKRESWDSGAVRDTQDNKPRYDLIPPKGLRRVADLYARGASKYDDHNWRKGMPSSRFMASMMRHMEQYRAGERDEDHIAAVIFNALALIEFEGTEWDDLTELW